MMNEIVKNETNISDTVLPKVLIIGQTFTTDTGGGITLSSLFKGWPKDKLAIAVESKEGIDFTRSSNYYRIGYKELRMPFPFFVFQRKTIAGPITEMAAVGDIAIKSTGRLKSRAKNHFDDFLHHTGLFFWMYGNQKVSSSLIAWIEDFKPDVIYYQPNSYKSLDFVLAIKDKFKLPMISHVMDDWFPFAVRISPLKWFWQRKLDEKIKTLFAATQLHLSICEYMSKEYLKRYGYTFYPFHNSVDLNFWRQSENKIKDLNTPIRLLYAGRLGYGVNNVLLKIAWIIEKMGNEHKSILLEIQTKDQNHSLVATFKSFNHVKVSGLIAYNKLPSKLADADILLIPCDFEGPGLKFIRYSMPTKVSEYMATGTPILVVGPPDTALIEYAKEGWAQLCMSDNESSIKKAIEELINSPELRKRIVSTSTLLAIKNHDEKSIITQFRQKMLILKNLSLSVN